MKKINAWIESFGLEDDETVSLVQQERFESVVTDFAWNYINGRKREQRKHLLDDLRSINLAGIAAGGGRGLLCGCGVVCVVPYCCRGGERCMRDGGRVVRVVVENPSEVWSVDTVSCALGWRTQFSF